MFENIFQVEIRLCCKNMEERKVEGRSKEETSRRVDADERSRITDREDEKNVERVNVWDTLRYYLDGFRYIDIDDDETEDAGL
ncbi:uncharacterized protein LOC724900 isoform X7 [Apis mellifera]|uniref:Uncharacterized protein LOC724900 isoform X7 n=2 Tax=Apis mellifera TaxID=7460 RepID=A0A7M7MG48_APIME|nr:uncharacterized protein LOC724900 isoform X7 [Apis mellifera]|eukprot:XP_026295236.1 uncharacterized protein LOC724900 isoform X7 [Apis mellifera]